MDYFYDDNDVQKEYDKFKPKREAKELDKIEKIYDPGRADITTDNRPYILNHKKAYGDKNFDKGTGVDFYLDGLRYLPDNITVVKAVVRVVDYKKEDVFRPCASLPKFYENNDSFSPVYDYRHEYRAEFFDCTSMLFITFITIDKANLESRIVGYSAINLFERNGIGGQPTSPTESDYVLREGAYQLNVYSRTPLREKPFTISKINKLNYLPCASCLVRIRRAPFKEDLKTVMNLQEHRHLGRKKLSKMGIWPPRPLYAQGLYNNDMQTISDNDKKLFVYRASRPAVPILDSIDQVLRLNNINKKMSVREMFEWCNKNITFDSNTRILDPTFFAQYQEQSGFKLAIDAIHNVPKAVPYIVHYTVNPEAEYYKKTDLEDPNQIPYTQGNFNFNYSYIRPRTQCIDRLEQTTRTS